MFDVDEPQADTFYALRYLPEVPLKHRKAEQTYGRFTTYLQAIEARENRLDEALLEIVERTVPAPKVMPEAGSRA